MDDEFDANAIVFTPTIPGYYLMADGTVILCKSDEEAAAEAVKHPANIGVITSATPAEASGLRK